MLSSSSILYNLRRISDPKRQPRHSTDFAELELQVENLTPPCPDPYSVEKEHWKDLSRSNAYKAVCLGLPAKVLGGYYFRLTTWPKLVADIEESTRKFFLGTPDLDDTGKTFALIETLSGIPGQWQPLKTFVRGKLKGRRGMTWWTTTNLPSPKTMCSAHTMGLFNNDVGTDVLILRCEARYFKTRTVRVPSIVDGYFFPVFNATQDIDAPIAGQAISLEEPILGPGADEYVVAAVDIDVDDVHVWPLNLNKVPVHTVYLPDRFAALADYYGRLA